MYNKTTVVGNVGADSVMRYTPAGKAVTSFNIATTRKWNGEGGEKHEKTTWFRVTCWGKQAEIMAQYVKKGMKVLVEGEIDASAWKDKESGEAKASLELTASNVVFLSSKAESEGAAAAPESGGARNGEDFPF